jgi:hypothetical protein
VKIPRFASGLTGFSIKPYDRRDIAALDTFVETPILMTECFA